MALRLKHFEYEVYFIGDLIKEPIENSDLVMLISGSGDTEEVVSKARKAKMLGARIFSLTSYADSELAKLSDLYLILPGGMRKGKGWKYVEAQLEKEKNFYGGGKFELFAYLFQEILVTTLGEYKKVSKSIIAKKHEKDEVLY